jgi:hypothetical protein
MRQVGSIALFVIFAAAIISVWVWGIISIVRSRRTRDYSERQVLGGTLRTARAGPLFSARWDPSTGPAFFLTALLYLVCYAVFAVFGFFPPIVLALFSVITAVWYVYRMRQTIGFDGLYARGATAALIAAVVITVAGLIARR